MTLIENKTINYSPQIKYSYFQQQQNHFISVHFSKLPFMKYELIFLQPDFIYYCSLIPVYYIIYEVNKIVDYIIETSMLSILFLSQRPKCHFFAIFFFCFIFNTSNITPI